METLITFKIAKLAKEKSFSSCLKSTIIISWSQDRDYRTQIPYEPNCFLNGEHFEDYEYSKEEFKSLFKDDDSYSADVQIPSQSVLQKWLREEHNIHIWASCKTNDDGKTIFIPHGRTIPDTIKNRLVVDIIPYSTHNTYEQAIEEALVEALNLI